MLLQRYAIYTLVLVKTLQDEVSNITTRIAASCNANHRGPYRGNGPVAVSAMWMELNKYSA